jgi:hypothetical protein
MGIEALAHGQRTIVQNLASRLSAFLVRFLPVGWITALVEKAAQIQKVTAYFQKVIRRGGRIWLTLRHIAA